VSRPGATARFGGEEKARAVAPALENARWQRVYDLAEARGYPAAVVDRALRLLR